MTLLLGGGITEASKLPVPKHELLAARLLRELAIEDDFNREIAVSARRLSAEASEEQHGGLTEVLDPDQL